MLCGRSPVWSHFATCDVICLHKGWFDRKAALLCNCSCYERHYVRRFYINKLYIMSNFGQSHIVLDVAASIVLCYWSLSQGHTQVGLHIPTHMFHCRLDTKCLYACLLENCLVTSYWSYDNFITRYKVDIKYSCINIIQAGSNMKNNSLKFLYSNIMSTNLTSYNLFSGYTQYLLLHFTLPTWAKIYLTSRIHCWLKCSVSETKNSFNINSY